MVSWSLLCIALSPLVAARPFNPLWKRQQSFVLANGQEAQALNARYQTLTPASPCQPNEVACIGGSFAQCANGAFVITPCAGGLQCFALPLVNKSGTSTTCDTQADAADRIARTGAAGGITGNGAPAPAPPPPAQAPVQSPPAQQQAPAQPAPAPPQQAGARPFTLQNGRDAQALNAGFLALNPNSPCSPSQNACIGDAFAQCDFGRFVITPCAGGSVCRALPLVNAAGTSITCTTTADAEARIAATGATGGVTGNGNGAVAPPPDKAAPAPAPAPPAPAPQQPAPAPAPPANNGDRPFVLQNGRDAQALNAGFAALNPGSPCTESACVNGGFAQCVNGSFVITQCAGGLQCFALPLVNAAGTSITCTTPADAQDRIARTGAAGGVRG